MVSRRCLRPAIGIGVICAGSATTAAQVVAEERAPGVDLSLVRGNGADECMTVDALEDEVKKRLRRDPFTRPAHQHIECLVLREDSAFVARLYERDPRGNRLGDRVLSVATADCRELDDALALAVALLIDPEYKAPTKDAVQQSNLPLSAADTKGDLSRMGAPLPASGSLPNLGRPPESRVSVLGSTGQLRLQPFAVAGDTRAMIGLGGSVGLLPRFGPDLSLSVQRRLRGQFHGYVSVLYVPERSVSDIGRSIGFGLTALKLAGCIEGRHKLAAFGCAGMVAGAIHAFVYEPRPVNPGDYGWAAVSLDGGARVSFGLVVLEIRGQFVVPLVHWKFNLMSGNRVYREAWISPGLAIAVGTHFP